MFNIINTTPDKQSKVLALFNNQKHPTITTKNNNVLNVITSVWYINLPVDIFLFFSTWYNFNPIVN